MTRSRRARSPAAEHELDLHSPTRRRIRHNKPRVHARPFACAYDSSDDDGTHLSSDDESPSIDEQDLEIVFEEPTDDAPPVRQQGARPRELPLPQTHDPLHATPPVTGDVAPCAPSTTQPWTPATTPSMPIPQRDPRPEPIADRLRRMARALRAENEASKENRNTPPKQDDDYIQNNAYLRGLVNEGKLGVYLDSSNHSIVRIVDCAPAPDVANAESDIAPPKTTTRRVRVQPPPELRRPRL